MNEKEQIINQILEALKSEPLKSAIKKAALFGSYLKGKEKSNSDVDILVELNPEIRVGLFKFVAMERILSERLGKKVDLLTYGALSRYFRDRVLKEAEVIYEK